MAIINYNNFLRWNSAAAESTAVLYPAKGYEKDKDRCNYQPLLVNGEGLSFYINTLDGLNAIITDPGTAKLKLVNAITGQVVNADIATLIQDLFTTSAGDAVYTFYASVTPSAIPPGQYLFRIGSDTENFLDSNYVTVPSNSDYLLYTCLCRFRHDRYFYGVNYQNIDTFYQQFRLHFNQTDAQYENDKDVYNEVTTGKQRTYNNYKKKTRKLEAYYFDDFAHDAAEVMFDSNEVYINGKVYVTKGTYKKITNVLSKVNKGEADVYDEEFATANRCLHDFEVDGSGGNCIPVAIPQGASLPNATAGQAYYYTFNLIGTLPIAMVINNKPTWAVGMDIVLNGNVVTFSGNASLDDVGGTVDLSFSNCTSDTAPFTDTVTVLAATNNIYICIDHSTETVGREIFLQCKSSVPVPHDVQMACVLHTSYNGDTSFEDYNFTRIIYQGNSQSSGLKISYSTLYSDEHFVGAQINSFTPPTDGIYTYQDGGLCS